MIKLKKKYLSYIQQFAVQDKIKHYLIYLFKKKKVKILKIKNYKYIFSNLPNILKQFLIQKITFKKYF